MIRVLVFETSAVNHLYQFLEVYDDSHSHKSVLLQLTLIARSVCI